MIYNNSVDCSEKQLVIKPCENCTTLKNQVKHLGNLFNVHKRKSRPGSCSWLLKFCFWEG